MASRFLAGLLDRLAAPLGLRVVPAWRLENLAQARHLATLLSRHRVDVVVDVGANRGGFRDFLRDEVGYDGPIVSIEPVRSLAAALEERARADGRWTIVEAALADATGRRRFNVMTSNTHSSFLDPDESATPAAARDNRIAEIVEVDAYRLDDLVPEYPILAGARRAFLKLDTQGYDLTVLRGASGFLESVAVLQTELSFVPIYRGMTPFDEAIAHVQRLGFMPSMFFPVGHLEDGTAVELDCVLVRSSLANARTAGPRPPANDGR